MLCLRAFTALRARRKQFACNLMYIVQINVIRLSHSLSPANEWKRGGDDRRIHIQSKVLYPNKHANNSKTLSSSQQQLYRTTIDTVQQFLSHRQSSSSSSEIDIDLCALLGTDSDIFQRIDVDELKRWLHKMPHIQVLPSREPGTIVINQDQHIERIDMISNRYPMISWRNRIDFKTHTHRRHHAPDNTVNHIRELVKYYQLHSCFSSHSAEAKMIIGRGLDPELSNAYTHLLKRNIRALSLTHFHHLFGNLGVNLLSYFGRILCDDPAKLMSLHFDLIQRKISNMNEFKCKYNPALNVDRYHVLLDFLLEHYPLYFVNRSEYDRIIFGGSQRLSDLETMPFLFEMKMLMKIGHLLDYINSYHQRLIYHPKMMNGGHDGYDFNIHRNQNRQLTTRHKLLQKRYEVYSEKQLENGDCHFSVERCTPDIVLSEPVWINNKAIYWFDAKCTKATNCLYDKKRQYQMYRFTKHYGNGAILALGAADLSVVGINDVIILDCSHYL